MNKPTIRFFAQDDFLSNMYLFYTELSLSEHWAAVIDPSRSKLLADELDMLGIRHILIMLTHEHFDHTCGINRVKQDFDSVLLCQEQAAERMLDPRNNRPLSLMFPNTGLERPVFSPYICKADETFRDEFSKKWFGTELKAYHIPGHSPGSCCIEVSDAVFTGDSLLPDIPTITRFPGGDTVAYRNIALPYLMQIPPERMICPGHGACFRFGDAVYQDGCFCIRKGDHEHNDR